jgi:hypothetical protein
MQYLRKALQYCVAPDPVNAIDRIYEKYRGAPRVLRGEYYAWLNRWIRRWGGLPSYGENRARLLRYIRLRPQVRQALVRAAAGSANSPGVNREDRLQQTVSIHLFQDWNLFSEATVEGFIGREIVVDEERRKVTGISLTQYPCDEKKLTDALDGSRCDTKIVFVYAFMFYHPQFCEWITRYLSQHPDTLVAVYFTDSHHMLRFGCALALLSDYLILSHPDNYQHLSSLNPYVYIDRPYLYQWNASVAYERCRKSRFIDRDFAIYGKHNAYREFWMRNEFLRALSEKYGPAVQLNTKAATKAWYAQNGEESLNEWLRYGISLIVPVRYDFTQRVCDALSAGHAVLMPKGCTWLDHWITAERQHELGIYRYCDYDETALEKACQRALERERGRDAQERAEQRSKFCVEMFSQESLLESFLRLTSAVLA